MWTTSLHGLVAVKYSFSLPASNQAMMFHRDYISPTFYVPESERLQLNTLLRVASSVIYLEFKDGLHELIQRLTWPTHLWSYWNVVDLKILLSTADSLEETSADFWPIFGLLKNLVSYYGYNLFLVVPHL